MDLKEKFTQDMHGGKEINGQIRINGHYMGEDEEGRSTVKFDNGNFYIFEDRDIIKHIDGNDEYFINDHITVEIHRFIDANPLMSKDFSYTDYNSEETVEFYFTKRSSNSNSRGTLIRLVINRQQKNIEISNIFIEPSMKHKGFGKQIIEEIFKIADKHNYKLYLVQMVPSFYNKMIARGATNISFEDIVEITSNTKLN